MSLLNTICRIVSILSFGMTVVSPLLVIYFFGTLADATGNAAAASGIFLAIPAGLLFFGLGLLFWWMGNVHDYLRDLSHDG